MDGATIPTTTRQKVAARARYRANRSPLEAPKKDLRAGWHPVPHWVCDPGMGLLWVLVGELAAGKDSRRDRCSPAILRTVYVAALAAHNHATMGKAAEGRERLVTLAPWDDMTLCHGTGVRYHTLRRAREALAKAGLILFAPHDLMLYRAFRPRLLSDRGAWAYLRYLREYGRFPEPDWWKERPREGLPGRRGAEDKGA